MHRGTIKKHLDAELFPTPVRRAIIGLIAQPLVAFR